MKNMGLNKEGWVSQYKITDKEVTDKASITLRYCQSLLGQEERCREDKTLPVETFYL